ncbi:sigma 54-interacting transcriptional regulator [Paenactinomyces guangxiensis]|uniref:Sigma 54-interacting transcriptional regulator n=1 Tax=Paenactinomyces guangxiensis TaxID=1490290 RepID=A0A7W1WPC3_9BACL|nr:sigma 54-interacting transcriptional regulator [Paenactinomyces guangxiensis]MBA4493530.1 sigma 54-interacting transcriptional regulator [Paenactinomyces guangxiensis]MBH8590621.1 sigma 54-interacting transcriptional regulator [Paenactinomyces guangxiensis]
MTISTVLKHNYAIISEAEWNQNPDFSRYSEYGLILLRDAKDAIIGAVWEGRPGEMIPVGIASLQMLEEDAEWDRYSVWIFTDPYRNILGWIERESLYRFLCHFYKTKKEFYETVLFSLPHRVTVIDGNSLICFVNEQEIQARGMAKNQIIGKRIHEIDKESSLERLLSDREKKTVIRLTDNKRGIYTQTNILKDGTSIGAIQVCWEAEEIEKIVMNLEAYTSLAQDLKAVFDLSYDVIYVSDGEGMTLRVSSASERLWGYKPEELVGKTVYELEKQGVFKPSITRLVLEKKDKVQTIQTTKTGKRLMVVGIPIKDEKGNIIRVINTSRDITQESRLQAELEAAKSIMQGYKQELEQLKQSAWKNDRLIFKSEQMRNLVTLAGKVAEVDSTVLILGESGVGKEVIASFIHQKSQRKENPFIKVNCGAIPENLLESELFGYEKGAFTGASKDGKRGLFEVANEGTLFLDEIGEIPLRLQVKLLRVLQEKELVRLGGTKPVRVNVRIIAATNRDLKEEVQKRAFREDLYYRLNVVPIQIPPLRERREDILPLALHFIDKFNREYNRNKMFSPEALEKLQAYKWPGNVRELQNIIERVVVIAEQQIIEPRHLPETLFHAQNNSNGISVSTIMPLDQAKELVERQLLAMAKERYGTTTRIAEVLGVNQSTVSRKITRLGIR